MKVFISSPGDVAEERALADLVFRRLVEEYRGKVQLEVVLWEHEPLFGHTGFQEQIDRPSSCDLVISILWSRLGTRLPASFATDPGTTAPTGTEFEINDALDAYRRLGKPNLLIYRKSAKPLYDLSSADADQRRDQYLRLDEFCRRAFYNEQGSVLVAHHKFAESYEFERKLELHARKWLAQQLPGGEAGPKPSWTLGSPYRGLRVFEAEHRAIYFGRLQAVSEVMRALRRAELQDDSGGAGAAGRFLLIQGMSGNGKSSLVRAGLLPLLEARALEGVGHWFTVLLKPSERHAGLETLGLFGVLAARLSAALPTLENTGTAVAELAQRLHAAPEQLAARLEGYLDSSAKQARLQPRQVRLLVFIDQLEELFTGATDAVQVERVASMVAALAHSGRAWVIATLRSDLSYRLEKVPALVELARGEGTYTLAPPRPSELAEMVREPARAAGLVWQERDGIPLDQVLLREAEASPESLPLLEYALDLLYERRDGNNLTYEAYEAFGGLQGAVSSSAEAVVQAGGAEADAAFSQLMRNLVSIDGQGTAARRYSPLHELAEGSGERHLLDALLERRLCVTDRRGTEPVALLAHEALLHSWDRVRQWLTVESSLLAIRHTVEREANAWSNHEEKDAWLATGPEKLSEFERLMTARLPLASHVHRFIGLSRQRARRATITRRAAAFSIAALALLASVTAFFALRQWDESQRQRALVLSRESLQQLTSGDVRSAQALAREAADVWHKRDGSPHPDADFALKMSALIQPITLPASMDGIVAAGTLGSSEGNWDSAGVTFSTIEGDVIAVPRQLNSTTMVKLGAGIALGASFTTDKKVVVVSSIGAVETIDLVDGERLTVSLDDPHKLLDMAVCNASICAASRDGVQVVLLDTNSMKHSRYTLNGEASVVEIRIIATDQLGILRDNGRLELYTTPAIGASMPASQVPTIASDASVEGVEKFAPRGDGTVFVATINGEVLLSAMDGSANKLLAQLSAPIVDLSVPRRGGLGLATLENGRVIVLRPPDVFQIPASADPVLHAYELEDLRAVLVIRYSGIAEIIEYETTTTSVKWNTADQALRASTFDLTTGTLLVVTESGQVRAWRVPNAFASPPSPRLSSMFRLNSLGSAIAVELTETVITQAKVAGVDWASGSHAMPEPLLVASANDLVVLGTNSGVDVSLGSQVWRLPPSNSAARGALRWTDELMVVWSDHDVRRFGLMEPRTRTTGDLYVSTLTFLSQSDRLRSLHRNSQKLLLGIMSSGLVIIDEKLQVIRAGPLTPALGSANLRVTDFSLDERERTLRIDTADCDTHLIHLPTGRSMLTAPRLCK